MRVEPTKAGREQMQRDRYAWKERQGDPDKEEINMGRRNEGCVHRWWEEMLRAENIKVERRTGGEAEATERHRK